MRWRFALPPHDPAGLHYVVRIFVGTALLWLLLPLVGLADPIWAVISLIVVTEPKPPNAWLAFISRIVNTLIGCGAGVLFLLVAGPQWWVLPVAVAATVLVCTYLVRVPLSWRIAPITTALVIAPAFAEQSQLAGLKVALQRTGEVLLGSATALAVSWLVSLVWAPPEPPQPAPPPPGAKS